MSKVKTYPVIEVFGPTVQGEGTDQGLPCVFVRFGGCDYKCGWCDTPHAVRAEEVRENATKMTTEEIVAQVKALHAPPYMVVLSGGNPAMHDLYWLLNDLRKEGYYSSVETQGSMWKDWFYRADRVCVSPKPPSSGMSTNWEILTHFAESLQPASAFFKVVVFDHLDLEYAAKVHTNFPWMPFFLSAGNDAGRTVGHPTRQDTRTHGEIVEDLLKSSERLVEMALKDGRFDDVRIQSQYHVLLYGNVQGV